MSLLLLSADDELAVGRLFAEIGAVGGGGELVGMNRWRVVVGTGGFGFKLVWDAPVFEIGRAHQVDIQYSWHAVHACKC